MEIKKKHLETQPAEELSSKTADLRDASAPQKSKGNTQFFSFRAWQDIDKKEENPTIYYFDLNEDGLPIKLGDGSYGSVYRVRNHREPLPKGEFAVKIYYPFKDLDKNFPREEDSVRKLFQEELGYMRHIRKIVDKEGIDQAKIKGVVTPRHGTDCFDTSEAAIELFMGEGKLAGKTKISSYALVMDLYEGTLKDLLEAKRNQEEFTGYEILRQLSPNERLELILPFISSVIEGLRTLNFGKFAHLDLKPANIFYKRNGNQFEMVVGDMGYLKIDKKEDRQLTVIEPLDDTSRRRLLGTRHYRSPEQKDSYDICDAEVWKAEKQSVFVKITDPKFEDSVMEAGDFIYFSKMSDNVRFLIKDIKAGSDSTGKYWVVSTEESIDETGRIPVIDHEVTQVVMLKKQQIRTDLFGVGAIAFDLLTAGNSPEFFYERIRAFDSADTKTGKNISQIIEMYQKVSSFNSNDPIARHVFSIFSHKDEFPRVEIVRFILRCMLFKSPGTYFYDFTEQNIEPHLFFDHLKNDFDRTFPNENMKWFRNNLIEHQLKASGTKIEPEQLVYILESVQNMGQEQSRERLLLGYKYLREIFRCIEGQVFKQPKNFFLEYYPTNVTKIRQQESDKFLFNLRCDNTAFETIEQYHNALLTGDIQLKLYTDKDDFFVPNYIVHLRKPIHLEEIIDQYNDFSANETAGSMGANNSPGYRQWEKSNFRYSFTSKSYAYDRVKVGDWVLAYRNDEPADLYRIIYADKQRLTLKHTKSTRKGEPAQAAISPGEYESAIKFVYFKDIDRLAYYLHLLGMYVHQFFFFEKGDSNSDILSFVDFVNIQIFRDHENKGNFHIRTDDENILRESIFKGTKSKNLAPKEFDILNIYVALTRLYARFTFHDMEGTFYRDLSGFESEEAKRVEYQKIFAAIYREFDNIRNRIEKPWGIITGILDDNDLPLPGEFDLSQFISLKENLDTTDAWPKNFDFIKTLEAVVSKPKSIKDGWSSWIK